MAESERGVSAVADPSGDVCAVAEVALAMAGVDLKGFKPVQFEFGQIHVRGGHMSKFAPMTTKTVRAQTGKDDTFVKLAFTESWLIHATTGQTKHSGSSFGRTSLLSELRTTVEKLCDGELPQASDTQEVGVEGDDYDPMAEIDQSSEATPAHTKVAGVPGVKRTRYYKNLCKNTVVTVNMPVRCPEQDAACTDLRRVKLLIEDRRQVWLHLDDLAWALQYLYVQNMLKGVPLVDPDSAGPGGA